MPSYCVSGAGNEAYNGTYDYVSAGEYVKVGSTTTKILYNGDGLWYFVIGATEGYTAEGVSGTLPLTGWIYQMYGNGYSPAPTITNGACTVTLVDPYCVAGAGTTIANGTYSYVNGSFNTFMSGYWQHTTEANLRLGLDYMNAAVIYNDYTQLYSASSLTGTWSVQSGSASAPTVTAGACGSSPTPTPTPTVTAISPTTGTTAGGTSVTITGTNLTGATAVTVGGTAATGVTVVSSTSITATTPAKTAGTASVLVTTPSGTNAANNLFTFVAPSPSPSPSPTTANIIRPKRSSTASATPTGLAAYEIAVNITDKKIWVADATGAPVLMSELNDLPPSIDGGVF